MKNGGDVLYGLSVDAVKVLGSNAEGRDGWMLVEFVSGEVVLNW